jgi:hypothetical protein
LNNFGKGKSLPFHEKKKEKEEDMGLPY